MKTKTYIKKTSISMLLIVALLITMAVPAFAGEQPFAFNDDVYLNYLEVAFVERDRKDVSLQKIGLIGFLPEERYIGTWPMEDGTLHVLTYIEHEDRSFSILFYIDGILKEINNVVPGSGEFETVSVENGNRDNIISFANTYTDSNRAQTIETFSARRVVGTATHSPITPGSARTVRAEVAEWFTPNMTLSVITNRYWHNAAAFTTAMIAGLGALASEIPFLQSELIASGIIHVAGGRFYQRSNTTLTGTRVEQDIHVFPVTSGGRNAVLTRSSRLAVNSSCGLIRGFFIQNSNGFSTGDWRTARLGREMFWRVFSMDVVPTSWTG